MSPNQLPNWIAHVELGFYRSSDTCVYIQFVYLRFAIALMSESAKK